MCDLGRKKSERKRSIAGIVLRHPASRAVDLVALDDALNDLARPTLFTTS